MEWMLQVVDEVTDTLDHARFRAIDFCVEIGIGGCALIAAAVLGLVVACGAPALVLAAALGALGSAVLLKARHHLAPAVEV